MTTTPLETLREELQSSKDAIEAAGREGADRDNAWTILAKGMSDGFAGLLGLTELLIKGKAKMPEPEPDDDKDDDDGDGGDEGGGGDEGAGGGGGDEGGGEGGGDEGAGGGGDGSPGYRDMRLALDENLDVDVTEYVTNLEKRVRSQGKLIRQQGRRLERMEKAQKEGNELLRALSESHAATTMPLLKGVQALGEQLSAAPALAAGANVIRERAAILRAPPKVKVEGGPDKVQMMKALQERLISEADLRHFRQHGTFDRPTQAESDALVRQIKALPS